MRHLTIRNVPAAVADALEREKECRGTSLNQTVIDLLTHSLGVVTTPTNGLGRLAGRWNEEEYQEFERAVAPFSEVDPDMWG